jgi:hypothetical protein
MPCSAALLYPHNRADASCAIQISAFDAQAAGDSTCCLTLPIAKIRFSIYNKKQAFSVFFQIGFSRCLDQCAIMNKYAGGKAKGWRRWDTRLFLMS